MRAREPWEIHTGKDDEVLRKQRMMPMRLLESPPAPMAQGQLNFIRRKVRWWNNWMVGWVDWAMRSGDSGVVGAWPRAACVAAWGCRKGQGNAWQQERKLMRTRLATPSSNLSLLLLRQPLLGHCPFAAPALAH